ncbi:hypothetical protein GCM10007169_20320 [Shewanella fodinae]|nr:hypothetical protein GCM10007169_20320 [Shewanella fodinae]
MPASSLAGITTEIKKLLLTLIAGICASTDKLKGHLLAEYYDPHMMPKTHGTEQVLSLDTISVL